MAGYLRELKNNSRKFRPRNNRDFNFVSFLTGVGGQRSTVHVLAGVSIPELQSVCGLEHRKCILTAGCTRGTFFSTALLILGIPIEWKYFKTLSRGVKGLEPGSITWQACV
jgi:hypothetical protein